MRAYAPGPAGSNRRLRILRRTVYEEAAYDLSIDYRRPPPPSPLSPEEEAWVRNLVPGG